MSTIKVKTMFVELIKDDFHIFDKECKKWIRFFNLYEWKIIITFEKIEENFECFADTITDYENQYALVRLNKEWPEEEFSEYNIRRAAFHEICEVLLSCPMMIAQSSIKKRNYLQESVINSERHKIIRKLEYCIFHRTYRKRKITNRKNNDKKPIGFINPKQEGSKENV